MKTYSILAGLLLTCWSLQAQWDQYAYQRELSDIRHTWHLIELPNEIFQRLTANYADIRIMGINEAGDTLIAPYLMERPEPRPAVEKIALSILNQSRQDSLYFVTLENPTEQKIEQLQLNLQDTNFDWRIRLEGSQDQTEWFKLLDNYRILSIDNELTKYTFTLLNFPTTQYRYYRVAIPSATDPVVRAATVNRQTNIVGEYRRYTPQRMTTTENRENKHTQFDITLPYIVPVSFLSIGVKDDFDYYRPLTILALTDSTATDTGWQYVYNPVYNGVLSSLEPREFTFPAVRTDRLRVIIQHHDNAPLTLSEIAVKGQVPLLKARFTENADYWLVYGNPQARLPRYDLAQFAEKIPDMPAPVQVGPEVLRGVSVANTASPSRAWLWVVMATVIALLAWFSLRILRESDAELNEKG